MDGVHCFMYHLYDFGLRSRKWNVNNVSKTSDMMNETPVGTNIIANCKRYSINKFDILSQSKYQGMILEFLLSNSNHSIIIHSE